MEKRKTDASAFTFIEETIGINVNSWRKYKLIDFQKLLRE